MRKLLKTKTEFTLQEFKDIITPKVQHQTKSKISGQIYELTLTEIFRIFDVDSGGTVDSKELANCLSLMCGGSLTEKLQAAFLLFDTDNSGTMGFDELVSLIKTVFNVVKF